MHGIRQSEIIDGVIAQQEEADIGRLQQLFAEYDVHMRGYQSFLDSHAPPQVGDVLEGIRRCAAFEPLLDAFGISGRHYEQYGLTRLANLIDDCRERTAKVRKRLETTVFADPELPEPPIATIPPETGAVIRRLADLDALVAKGTPYWIAYAMVEAKYRDAALLHPDSGAGASPAVNPQA